jgi:alkylation response protein AidB-like acyl-CoA dehydrogenase
VRRTLYTDDHESFRAAVRPYVQRVVAADYPQAMDRHQIGAEVWTEAARLGVLGLEIPDEFGGSKADDYGFNAVAIEELATVSAAYASCLSIHFDIVAPYLVDLGTEPFREKWLPRVAAGEVICAIAMTEPSGGSDLASLRTTAHRSGDDWVLNGAKTFITNGYSADLVVVAARSNPEARASRGITLLAVDASTPGFRRGTRLDKIGQPEADTAELFFDDVVVPADHVLGTVDSGFIHMMERLPQERLGSAIANTAHARRALDDTVAYARERRAFGAPIGSFQHVKFVLAEAVTKLDVTQAYVDQCIAAHAVGELSAVDAAKAKAWSSEVQNQVIDTCVQVHGGYGYMREYAVARAWIDARVTRIWAGTNEIMNEIIGRDLGL